MDTNIQIGLAGLGVNILGLSLQFIGLSVPEPLFLAILVIGSTLILYALVRYFEDRGLPRLDAKRKGQIARRTPLSPEIVRGEEEIWYDRLKTEHQRKFRVDPPELWLAMESKRLARNAASWWGVGLRPHHSHKKLLAEYGIALQNRILFHGGCHDGDGLMVIFSRGDSPLIEGPCSTCGISRHKKRSQHPGQSS